MPYPPRTANLPSLKGSQAKPSLGPNVLACEVVTASPYGEFTPATITPSKGSQAGSAHGPRKPVGVMVGALVGSNIEGTKLVRTFCASVGGRIYDQRTPALMVRLGR